MQADQVTSNDCGMIDEKRDGQRNYLIRPEDHDLFIRTGEQIIAHCRLGISVATWFEEVQALLCEVGEWCARQEGKVRACYAAPTAKVTLFFVPASDSYDFELGADLAELNVSWVGKFNVGVVETRQIPWTERDRFIRKEACQTVYGEPC